MKYDYFNTENIKKEDVIATCPVNEYRVIPPQQLPFPFPQKLLRKCDSVFVTVSGGPNDVAYAMFNFNRVDGIAVDQMPFMVGFIGEDPTVSGSLVQHGNWPGRTTYPGQGFLDNLTASGIGNCYPISELPTTTSGSIYDLKPSSQEGAWSAAIRRIEPFLDPKASK
jgi:hypothetical protein